MTYVISGTKSSEEWKAEREAERKAKRDRFNNLYHTAKSRADRAVEQVQEPDQTKGKAVVRLPGNTKLAYFLKNEGLAIKEKGKTGYAIPCHLENYMLGSAWAIEFAKYLKSNGELATAEATLA